MNCLRRPWFHCRAVALLSMMTVAVSVRADEWKTHEVRQLGEIGVSDLRGDGSSEVTVMIAARSAHSAV